VAKLWTALHPIIHLTHALEYSPTLVLDDALKVFNKHARPIRPTGVVASGYLLVGLVKLSVPRLALFANPRKLYCCIFFARVLWAVLEVVRNQRVASVGTRMCRDVGDAWVPQRYGVLKHAAGLEIDGLARIELLSELTSLSLNRGVRSQKGVVRTAQCIAARTHADKRDKCFCAHGRGNCRDILRVKEIC